MSDDFESQLRAALRPVAPSDDFTPKIMARIAAKRRLAPCMVDSRESRRILAHCDRRAAPRPRISRT